MKKVFNNFITLASFSMLGVFGYKLFDAGVVQAASLEIRRYSDINVNYIYIMIGFVVLSFVMGWAIPKLRVE